ncbi:hypothetical protein [Erythrobacter sp. MTPC3]|uniref:hypothetical protein n=1 Tax=Erythrobacter sp. MTPC3 TaxID=3056564 RepID=UPI0036F24A09
MKSILSIAVAGAFLAMSTSATAQDAPKLPVSPVEKGKDVKKKPDGFIPDTPRVPDTDAPKVDTPTPNVDPKTKPDGWVPDTPKVPD